MVEKGSPASMHINSASIGQFNVVSVQFTGSLYV